MTLYNADDYGVTAAQCGHILDCRRDGKLTGVSAMPNSPYLPEAMARLAGDPELHVAVHLNLTEGLCLSEPSEIPLLAGADGRFRLSFFRLLTLSLGGRRKALAFQMEQEFFAQMTNVTRLSGARSLRLDGHQHIQMIPAVLRAACRAADRTGLSVEYIRFSREPLGPYLRHPEFWRDYRAVNIVKNLVLNVLAWFDGGIMRRMGLPRGMVMGLVLSGNLERRFVERLLPDFERLSARRGRTLELVMHPGWGIGPGESLDVPGGPFEAFNLDEGRRREYDCLLSGGAEPSRRESGETS